MVKILSATQFIVSETDLYGIITFANEAFADACELDATILVGFNHNIIRHPHMPSRAFKELWDTIEANKDWHGIVKNSTFDGKKVYWVKAHVYPIFDEDNVKTGYRSDRRQATDEEIAWAMKTYGIEFD